MDDHNPEKCRSNHRVLILAAVCFLIVITGMLYRPVTGYDFINFDDDEYVYENSVVTKGLTEEGIAWALTDRHSANWHPLTWISHMADVEIFGLLPGGHHLTNLLIHILNTLLLFGVLYKMTGDFSPSIFVAAFFGIHPLHIESVTWISERKDLLCTFFGFACLWCYTGYVQNGGKLRYLLSLLLFILGLTAKPMLVTWPFVLLLLDIWPLGRLEGVSQGILTQKGRVRKREPGYLIREKLPWIFFSFVSSGVTIWAQKGSGALGDVSHFPLDARLCNAAVSYMEYIIKALVPWPLAVFYPYDAGRLTAEVVFLAGFAIILFFLLALVSFRRYPFVAVGWLWFVGTLVPVIGIVQVGSQSMADRYMYIPMTGLLVMVAWMLKHVLQNRLPKGALAAGFCLLLIPYFALAHRQLSHWENSEKLFAHTLDVTENNPLAHYNLGLSVSQKGKTEEAIRQYRAVLALNPSHAKAHNNLGIELEAVGKVREAYDHYEKSLKIQPDNSKTLNNMGVWLVRNGQPEKAIGYLRKAVAIDKDFAGAYNTLAVALCKLGREEDAFDSFRRAIYIDPEFFQAAVNLKIAKIRGLCRSTERPSGRQAGVTDQEHTGVQFSEDGRHP